MLNLKGMRIAFSGPHGTGKTTLAAYVANHYNIPFIGSPARAIHQSHGVTAATARTLDYTSHRALQELIENRLLINARIAGVHDRTIVDAVAYSLLNKLSTNETLKLLQRKQVDANRETETFYDLVFVMYPWRPAVADGFRELDNGQRLVLYYTMRGLWKDYENLSGHVREIPNLTIEDSMQYVVEKIEQLLR